MKRSTLVRFISVFVTVVCLGNWRLNFLHATFEGAWEWNSLRLLDIVELWSLKFPLTVAYGYSLKVIAVAAVGTGCLPLIAGFHGIIRPTARTLLPVAATCSTLVAISIIAIYSVFHALLDQKGRPILDSGAGTYVAVVIIGLEILAAIISRGKIKST